MDTIPPGSKMAPKALALFTARNVVSPMHSLLWQGIDPVRGRNGAEGKGKG